MAAKQGRFPPIEARNKSGETILFYALRDEKQCVQAPALELGEPTYSVSDRKRESWITLPSEWKIYPG